MQTRTISGAMALLAVSLGVTGAANAENPKSRAQNAQTDACTGHSTANYLKDALSPTAASDCASMTVKFDPKTPQGPSANHVKFFAPATAAKTDNKPAGN